MRRDLPLVVRFRRGVWIGFVVAAAIGVGTLVLTESTTRSAVASHEIATLASQQRLQLSQLSSDLQRLASTEDFALESLYRSRVGDGVDAIRTTQVELEIRDPAMATMTVDLGNGASLREALELAFATVKSTVANLESEVGELPGAPPDISRSLDRIDQLDSSYAEIAGSAGSASSGTTNRLRVGGRVIALVAAIAAALRLFVVGRPLVTRLESEQVAVSEERILSAAENRRQELSTRMGDGMETATSEPAALAVVERALGAVVPHMPAELLLADSSMAHMSIAVGNGEIPAPGCGVTSPWSCTAVRRSGTMTFEDSESVRSCPYLTGRDGGPCSAVCVPVSFLGGAMGVLHVTGEVGWKPDVDTIGALEVVAHHTAVRIGTLRSFAKAEVQASTDVLTGLPNRRATEDHLGTYLAGRERGSVAMADLDHFKSLNDTFGHEVGDRALRTFSDAVREALREGDWVGRWGGEEFVMLLPGLSATEASKVLERVRRRLALQCSRSDIPDFTVSIGVVDTTAGSTAEDLVRMADDCLYAAKEEGRDRVVIGPVAPQPAEEIESSQQR